MYTCTTFEGLLFQFSLTFSSFCTGLVHEQEVATFYLSNRPQVSMGYKLINHVGCWVEHEKNLHWALCFSIIDHVIFFGELFFYPSKNCSFIFIQLFENLKTGIDQFRYIKIQSQTKDLRTRLWGLNHKRCIYSPEPRTEVYCFKLNLNTSKLVYYQEYRHVV